MYLSTKVQIPNNWKYIYILFFFIALSFLWLGYHFGDRLGLTLGLIASIFTCTWIIFYSDHHLLKELEANELKGRDPWGLLEKVNFLSDKLKIDPPRVFIFESKSAQIFTTPQINSPMIIGLSSSFLNKLSLESLDTMICLALINCKEQMKIHHLFLYVILHSLLNFANYLDRLWPIDFFFDKKQRPFSRFILFIFGFLYNWTHLWASQHKKDFETLKLTPHPETFAETLWQIHSLSENCPLITSPGTEQYFLIPSFRGLPRWPLLKVQLPIEVRLQKIAGYFPI